MKLFLLSQTVNKDYDTYDSCVVACKTVDEALTMHPNGSENKETDDQTFSSWALPKDVKVKYVGEATRGTKKGVICASFNAG